MKSSGENKVVGRGVDGWGDEEKNRRGYPCSEVVSVSRGPNFEGEADCEADSILRTVGEKWNYVRVVKVAPTPKGIVYLALYRL